MLDGCFDYVLSGDNSGVAGDGEDNFVEVSVNPKERFHGIVAGCGEAALQGNAKLCEAVGIVGFVLGLGFGESGVIFSRGNHQPREDCSVASRPRLTGGDKAVALDVGLALAVKNVRLNCLHSFPGVKAATVFRIKINCHVFTSIT